VPSYQFDRREIWSYIDSGSARTLRALALRAKVGGRNDVFGLSG